MVHTIDSGDTYESHGGEDVPILANGPWAHLFVGVHEQSYFCHAIEHAAGWRSSQETLHSSSKLLLFLLFASLLNFNSCTV